MGWVGGPPESKALGFTERRRLTVSKNQHPNPKQQLSLLEGKASTVRLGQICTREIHSKYKVSVPEVVFGILPVALLWPNRMPFSQAVHVIKMTGRTSQHSLQKDMIQLLYMLKHIFKNIIDLDLLQAFLSDLNRGLLNGSFFAGFGLSVLAASRSF